MGKVLTIFYSRAGENHYAGGLKDLEIGNTHLAAKWIADACQGDLFQVETVVPYAASYRECCQQAVAEWKGNARPAVQAMPEGIDRYDTVVVGYPLWCGTMPMCLYTVLEQLDLTGKRVLALCTHEGSGWAGSVKALQQLCPGARVEEGLCLKGSEVRASEAAIRSWARERLL